jgi:hypothetical protein
MYTLKRYFPGFCWATALTLLYFLHPAENAMSFCLLSHLGISICPGCGIGHAIHYALHFQFRESFHAHLLGIPATIGIAYLSIKPFLITNKMYATYEHATNAHDASGPAT